MQMELRLDPRKFPVAVIFVAGRRRDPRAAFLPPDSSFVCLFVFSLDPKLRPVVASVVRPCPVCWMFVVNDVKVRLLTVERA